MCITTNPLARASSKRPLVAVTRRGTNGFTAANAARRAAALPRWNEALRLRDSGLKWREVAGKLGVDIAQAHRMASEAEAHRHKSLNAQRSTDNDCHERPD